MRLHPTIDKVGTHRLVVEAWWWTFGVKWGSLQWEWIASDRGTREKKDDAKSERAIEGTETRVGHEGR